MGQAIKVVYANQNIKNLKIQERYQCPVMLEIKDIKGLTLNFQEILEVAKLGIYDVILGKLWHKRFQPQVDYCNNIYNININKKIYTLCDKNEKEKENYQLETISMQQVGKELKRKEIEEIFLCVV